MRLRIFLCLVACVLAILALKAADRPLRIVIIGDSTVCEYPASRPDRGWGHYIQNYFKDGTATVINLAAGGRSTKTFVEEGRWTKALAEKPDYVWIQFGHNDSHAPDRPEATNAKTDYQDFLCRYIDETRAIGAVPILITPMVRRYFDPRGKITDPSPRDRHLSAYAEAVIKVGKEKSVSVINLHASSLALAEKLGPKASDEFANKPGYRTHFNEKGARAMAELVMKGMPGAAPKLKPRLK